jgi:hypothetical protein
VLVQDAAFMVTVPFFCPDTPHLKRNPVFLYSSDRFQKPYPFRPDIAVAVDDVFEQKLKAIDKLVSQAYEGGAGGSEERLSRVPPASQPKLRLAWLRERWQRRQANVANTYRESLKSLYGEEVARKIKYAEVFEICEYGRRPRGEELRKLFPFFPKR